MARVNYSAEINELRGSVGGTTFQRNKSGTIAKLKAVLTYNPSSNQQVSRSAFNSIVKAWSEISFSDKLLWNAFALTYPKYDYFGTERQLSGFNWFVSINSNRALTNQSQLDAPPVYATPITAPQFQVYALTSSLSIIFDTFPEIDNYYLFVYATPPLRSVNLQSRKSLRLISVINPEPVLFKDLTTDWENYFGIAWPPSTVNEAFNVLIAVSCVDKVTGIAGSFFLVNQPFNSTMSFANIGDTFTDLGQQFGETFVHVINGIGSGIVMAGTGNSGLILRSTDSGASFASLPGPIATSSVRALASCGAGIIVMGCLSTAHIYRSTDYGVSWADLGQQFAQGVITNIVYLGNGIVIAGTSTGGLIIRSTDYGATWVSLGQIGTQTNIHAITNCGNGRVLIGTFPGSELYVSTDYGLTFSFIRNLSPNAYCEELLYLGNGVVIASTNNLGEIWRSTDSGATWLNIGNQFGATAYITILAITPDVLFAGAAQLAKLIRSVDGGVTWSDLGTIGAESQIRYIGVTDYTRLILGTGLTGKVLYSDPA